jgi:hypothetical protein
VTKKPEQIPFSDGCSYIVAISHVKVPSADKKAGQAYKIFCNKLVESGTQYCPLHNLVVADEAKEPERQRLARKAKREYWQAENDALALSPLRAENPRFEDKIQGTGYQPAERK